MTKMSLSCVAIIAAALAGCTGTMQGTVRGEGTPVVVVWQQGLDSDTYTAVVGGERFTGRAVMADASETATFATAFGILPGGRLATAQGFAVTTSGKFKAILLGDRGSTLRCLMHYADTSGFTPSGGVGECHHSDGRVIDVVW